MRLNPLIVATLLLLGAFSAANAAPGNQLSFSGGEAYVLFHKEMRSVRAGLVIVESGIGLSILAPTGWEEKNWKETIGKSFVLVTQDQFQNYYEMNADNAPKLAEATAFVSSLRNFAVARDLFVWTRGVLTGEIKVGIAEPILTLLQQQFIQKVAKRKERTPLTGEMLAALVRDGKSLEIKLAAANEIRWTSQVEQKLLVAHEQLIPPTGSTSWEQLVVAAYTLGIITHAEVVPAMKLDKLSPQAMKRLVQFVSKIKNDQGEPHQQAHQLASGHLSRYIPSTDLSTSETGELLSLFGRLFAFDPEGDQLLDEMFTSHSDVVRAGATRGILGRNLTHEGHHVDLQSIRLLRIDGLVYTDEAPVQIVEAYLEYVPTIFNNNWITYEQVEPVLINYFRRTDRVAKEAPIELLSALLQIGRDVNVPNEWLQAACLRFQEVVDLGQIPVLEWAELAAHYKNQRFLIPAELTAPAEDMSGFQKVKKSLVETREPIKFMLRNEIAKLRNQPRKITGREIKVIAKQVHVKR